MVCIMFIDLRRAYDSEDYNILFKAQGKRCINKDDEEMMKMIKMIYRNN